MFLISFFSRIIQCKLQLVILPLLHPVLRDISQDFEQNFVGMTIENVTLDTLLKARKNLISDVAGNMPDNQKRFFTLIL